MSIQSGYSNIDRRYNMYELNNRPDHEKSALYPDLANIQRNAEAVGCLMKDENIIETNQNYILSQTVRNLSDEVWHTKIDSEKPEVFGAPLAPTEKFRTELAPGFGSCFLITRTKVLTAGHCVWRITHLIYYRWMK